MEEGYRGVPVRRRNASPFRCWGAESRGSKTPCLRPGEGATLALNFFTPTLPSVVLDVVAPRTFNLRALRLSGRRWEGTPAGAWNWTERGEKKRERSLRWETPCQFWFWPGAGKNRWLRDPKLQPLGPSTKCWPLPSPPGKIPRSLKVSWALGTVLPISSHQPLAQYSV